MKKILALILTTLMLFSLAACKDEGNDEGGGDGGSQISGGTNNGGSGNGGSGSGTGSGGTSGGGTEGGGTGSGGTSSKEKIDLAKITESTAFSEGKAWVRYGQVGETEYNTVYCINKNGEILFSLDLGGNVTASSFHNGLSALEIPEIGHRAYAFCDDSGNVIHPSDVGATEFLNPIQYQNGAPAGTQSFRDGYIFAKKVDVTFNSSTTTMAVYNFNMEKIIDYSEELLAFFNLNNTYDSVYTYVNGFLCLPHENKYLDLKNNQIKTEQEFQAVCTSNEWIYNSYNYSYLHPITEESVLDLSQYANSIYAAYGFKNGKAPIVFQSAGICFYTIINDDGSFCFDPVQVPDDWNSSLRIQEYNGKYLCSESFLSGKNECRFILFDAAGNTIKEYTLNHSESALYSTSFSDGVIMVKIFNVNRYAYSYKYYTMDFEPLF